ncbi:MAG: hypothetical protein LBE20_00800 [Deltaproteobacteria bacterium]|jgi:hypothetical protein|nr:hypothetical protein [Deltaproteobacteria bacterium]
MKKELNKILLLTIFLSIPALSLSANTSSIPTVFLSENQNQQTTSSSQSSFQVACYYKTSGAQKGYGSFFYDNKTVEITGNIPQCLADAVVKAYHYCYNDKNITLAQGIKDVAKITDDPSLANILSQMNAKLENLNNESIPPYYLNGLSFSQNISEKNNQNATCGNTPNHFYCQNLKNTITQSACNEMANLKGLLCDKIEGDQVYMHQHGVTDVAFTYHGSGDECINNAFEHYAFGEIKGWTWTRNVDANCKVITDLTGLKQCGNVSTYWAITPISLIWNDKIPIQPAVTQFPLDSKKPGQWYIWKASENTPLIVWDKKYKKEIISVEQLFGQKTFGKTWKDGFEALASLDKNQDRIVNGNELNELALWFDKNQNGISEKGEIKTLKEAGVTALYYTKDGDDPQTGDIIVSKGYTKTDGTTGAAIDWMAKTGYVTKEEAIKAANQEIEKAGQAALKSSFGGVWVWSVDKEFITSELTMPIGTMTLAEKDGKVKGVLASEVPIEHPSNVTSIQFFARLEGEKTVSNGINRVKFIVMNEEDLTTEMTAELSADGDLMFGVSRTELYLDSNKKTDKQTAHYTWKAKRAKLPI